MKSLMTRVRKVVEHLELLEHRMARAILHATWYKPMQERDILWFPVPLFY